MTISGAAKKERRVCEGLRPFTLIPRTVITWTVVTWTVRFIYLFGIELAPSFTSSEAYFISHAGTDLYH